MTLQELESIVKEAFPGMPYQYRVSHNEIALEVYPGYKEHCVHFFCREANHTCKDFEILYKDWKLIIPESDIENNREFIIKLLGYRENFKNYKI